MAKTDKTAKTWSPEVEAPKLPPHLEPAVVGVRQAKANAKAERAGD